MKISQAGFDRIKGYEAYKRELPDGSCTAYQERINGKLDIPTIGWGCTEGVTMGMVWSKAEAEAALLQEIAKHERAVMRLVAVDLNQNQFDALVSLSYNIGAGALGKSTLLKKLNASDYAGAQAQFLVWNKFNGAASRGLSNRRASEAALFSMRTAEEHKERPPQVMPQAVDVPQEPMSDTSKAAIAIVTTVTTTHAALPSVPQSWLDAISSAGVWQAAGEQIAGFGKAALANPALAVGIAVVIAALWFWPKIVDRLKHLRGLS